MKRILLMFALITGMLFCVSTVAGAYSMWDIDVGDDILVYGYNHSNNAGEFDMKASTESDHDPFITYTSFCAEHDKYLRLNRWYTITALSDPSDQSAYLLSRYYGGFLTLANEAEEVAFQDALWFYDSGKPGISNTYTAIADAAYTAGWRNDGYVFIADLG